MVAFNGNRFDNGDEPSEDSELDHDAAASNSPILAFAKVKAECLKILIKFGMTSGLSPMSTFVLTHTVCMEMIEATFALDAAAADPESKELAGMLARCADEHAKNLRFLQEKL